MLYVMPSWLEKLSSNALRAIAAQEYPLASLRLLGGGEFYFSDLIAKAERREGTVIIVPLDNQH